MAQTVDRRPKSNLDVFIKARNLLDYTLKKTANKKIFRPDIYKEEKELKNLIKQYGSTLYDKEKDLKDIIHHCYMADKDTEVELRNVLTHFSSNDQKTIQTIITLVELIDNLQDPVENTYVWLINELRRSAKEIFFYSWRANNIRVGTNKQYRDMRLEYQKCSILACVDLKANISLAKRHCHLKSKTVQFWNKKTNEVMEELTAWHNNDKKRYANI